MNEFLDIPTLIVIGLAIVVLFRLRQVLGTRTGRERSPLERQREAAPVKAGEDKVVPMRPRPVQDNSEDLARQARKLDAEVAQFSNGDEKVARRPQGDHRGRFRASRRRTSSRAPRAPTR